MEEKEWLSHSNYFKFLDKSSVNLGLNYKSKETIVGKVAMRALGH